MKKKKLGEVLSERGHISPSNLAQAVAEQQGKIILLGELLLELDVAWCSLVVAGSTTTGAGAATTIGGGATTTGAGYTATGDGA